MDIHFKHNGQNFVATPVGVEKDAKQNFEIYDASDEFMGDLLMDHTKNPDEQLIRWSAYH